MDWWDLTVRFFSLSDINVRNVVFGSMLLGCLSGCLSTFVYLQKRSLLGDALSHAALPGVGIAFLVVGTKDLPSLMLGAAVTAWLGALAVNFIVKRTIIKLDSALGIVLSGCFGLGTVILTYIQKSGSGAQSGLDKFLFGQAAALSGDDVRLLAWMTLSILFVVIVGFNRFKLLSFDPGFASTIGLKVGWLQFLLTTMIVMAVVAGLQAVGVVLMAAMMITPAAAARQWTESFPWMTVLSSLFGIMAGVMGAYISFLAPKFPTGPWIVVVISMIFLVSVLFAPERGVLSRMRHHLRRRRKMTHDHVLKALYKVGLEEKSWGGSYDRQDMISRFRFQAGEINPALNRLREEGLIERDNGRFKLTPQGIEQGARVIRLHRLWEVYLTRFLELPADHVHRDAEEMEHVLTPEMEERLEKLLDYPEYDPHQQAIPYRGKEQQT